MEYYAGIGSRRTPDSVLTLMRLIAWQLAKLGWTLRSGAAPGADSAFEEGCATGAGEMEIYLPWKRFNGHPSPLHTVSDAALELAAQFHPAWERCSPAAQKLHARNGHQILGLDLATPVSRVICWTPGGTGTGGTGQALRIARHHGIVVHDLGITRVREAYENRIYSSPA